MKIKRSILLIFAILPLSLYAQNETRDSVAYNIGLYDKNININKSTKPDCIKSQEHSISNATYYNPALDTLFPYRLARPLDLHIPDLSFTPGQARLFYWNSGEIIASGGVQRLPGMMQLESGAIGIYQNAGNFSFYVGRVANKYGYYSHG